MSDENRDENRDEIQDVMFPLYNNAKLDDCALYDKVEFIDGEKELIRTMMLEFMRDEIERSNLYFDHFIEKTRIRLNSALNILHKISRSNQKFNENIIPAKIVEL